MPRPGGIDSRRISGAEQRQALAVRQAVEAAGGLEACAQVTAAGRSQLHRCTSPHHPDSITIRDAMAIESIGHGRPGHPHITRMMALAQGHVLIRLPDCPDDPHGLMLTVVQMTKDMGDVAERIGDSLAHGSDGDEDVTGIEAMAALIELQDLEERCAVLRVTLRRLAGMEVADGVLSGGQDLRRPA